MNEQASEVFENVYGRLGLAPADAARSVFARAWGLSAEAENIHCQFALRRMLHKYQRNQEVLDAIEECISVIECRRVPAEQDE